MVLRYWPMCEPIEEHHAKSLQNSYSPAKKPGIFVFYGTFDVFYFLRYNAIIDMKEELCMSILEEFWYGNLDPAEYDASPSEEYRELIRLISRNEEKLLATMTDTQKDLFSRYQDCVREFQAMAECLLFQNSFRLGARMMLEIMEE